MPPPAPSLLTVGLWMGLLVWPVLVCFWEAEQFRSTKHWLHP